MMEILIFFSMRFVAKLELWKHIIKFPLFVFTTSLVATLQKLNI
jgi:hypothetical protein